MKNTSTALPDDPAQLKEMLLALQGAVVAKDKEIASLHAEISSLLEKFNLAQQKQFGKSSEAHPGHGELFNEAEIEQDTDTQVDEEPVTKTKKQAKLPADLSREEVVHDICESEKTCACCGGQLHEMGSERSEKLVFTPAKVKVVEHIRLKYSCRACDNSGTVSEIKTAPPPASPIPKGIATSSLLSQIMVSKYQHGLWQSVVHADEIPLSVIQEDKANCYMWVYCSGSDALKNRPDALNNIVLFDYQNSRAGACPVDYLQGYSGYLQVDGYKAYEQTKATLVGCMAHARRKFKEAEVAQPKGKTGNTNPIN